MKKLNLVQGKSYLTRDGATTKITHVDADEPDFPFHASNGQQYTPEGRWAMFCEDGEDLVAEVIIPQEEQNVLNPFATMAKQLESFKSLWYLYTPEKH